MATRDWTPLATRIPRSLHRRVKIYCAHAGVTLMDFFVDAVRERLDRLRRRERD